MAPADPRQNDVLILNRQNGHRQHGIIAFPPVNKILRVLSSAEPCVVSCFVTVHGTDQRKRKGGIEGLYLVFV